MWGGGGGVVLKLTWINIKYNIKKLTCNISIFFFNNISYFTLQKLQKLIYLLNFV